MDALHQLPFRHWNDAIEILLISLVIYFAWRHFRGTRAARVLVGIVIFLVGLTLLSRVLGLEVISWLLARSPMFFAISLVIMFQPELRRAFAELGSQPLFAGGRQSKEELDALCECVFELADKQCGALIAIEREVGVRPYAESGVEIDCAFSSELVRTVFFPKTPLHDGGMILRDGRIVAAACIFPVSQRESLDRSLGLRHRAGLGISEETDAIAVIVSEETGGVSLCYKGRLDRNLSAPEFRRRLGRLLLGVELPAGGPTALLDQQDRDAA